MVQDIRCTGNYLILPVFYHLFVLLVMVLQNFTKLGAGDWGQGGAGGAGGAGGDEELILFFFSL
jgi:hypothetical protein